MHTQYLTVCRKRNAAKLVRNKSTKQWYWEGWYNIHIPELKMKKKFSITYIRPWPERQMAKNGWPKQALTLQCYGSSIRIIFLIMIKTPHSTPDSGLLTCEEC